MEHKSLQHKFLELVQSLNLRFPVAEIAEKMKIGQPTVSTYLSGKRPVAQKFFKSFCEAYGLNYELLKSGRSENAISSNGNIEPTPMQILDRLSQAFIDQAAAFRAQTELMKSIENKMARADAQATITKQLEQISASLADSQEVDLLAAKHQEEKFAEIANLLLRGLSGKKPPSSGGGRIRGETDGGVHKPRKKSS